MAQQAVIWASCPLKEVAGIQVMRDRWQCGRELNLPLGTFAQFKAIVAIIELTQNQQLSLAILIQIGTGQDRIGGGLENSSTTDQAAIVFKHLVGRNTGDTVFASHDEFHLAIPVHIRENTGFGGVEGRIEDRARQQLGSIIIEHLDHIGAGSDHAAHRDDLIPPIPIDVRGA